MNTLTGRTETAAFPATEASVGEARRWLSEILPCHPRQDDAVLLLSEAATNAVVHTDSAVVGVTVVVEENGDVLVQVADEGARTLPSVLPRPDDDLATRGRGIRLIRALSSRWGFTEEEARCVLWFVLSARGEAQASGTPASTASPAPVRPADHTRATRTT